MANEVQKSDCTVNDCLLKIVALMARKKAEKEYI